MEWEAAAGQVFCCSRAHYAIVSRHRWGNGEQWVKIALDHDYVAGVMAWMTMTAAGMVESLGHLSPVERMELANMLIPAWLAWMQTEEGKATLEGLGLPIEMAQQAFAAGEAIAKGVAEVANREASDGEA